MIDENERFLQVLYQQRKQLNEHIAKYEIAALENADPYAELKAAHADGKRIAIKSTRRGKSAYILANRPMWDGIVSDYKIVDDDSSRSVQVISGFGDVMTKYTKCALTGKITAEVVE